jgi:hypothetical protein
VIYACVPAKAGNSRPPQAGAYTESLGESETVLGTPPNDPVAPVSELRNVLFHKPVAEVKGSDILEETLVKCLIAAHDSNFKSITLPLFGFGEYDSPIHFICCTA